MLFLVHQTKMGQCIDVIADAVFSSADGIGQVLHSLVGAVLPQMNQDLEAGWSQSASSASEKVHGDDHEPVRDGLGVGERLLDEALGQVQVFLDHALS